MKTFPSYVIMSYLKSYALTFQFLKALSQEASMLDIILEEPDPRISSTPRLRPAKVCRRCCKLHGE